jgi:predicted Zn-dependent peptidase
LPQHTLADSRLRSVTLPKGVRLHVLSSDRFTTTLVRVVLHRDLGPEATATSLLSSVLESATEKHPSREAVAHRLADLYGAGLSVGVEKLGDRQLLSASLDWPSSGLPGRGATLADGLQFLREVLTEPKLDAHHGDRFDAEIVATEAKNLSRSLEALRDDKGRHALRRCLEDACRGEPFALDVEGRVEDVAAATPERLAAVHRRLLATAPVEIFVAGELDAREARDAVVTHLLWPGRASKPADVPSVASVHAPRKRPVRLVEPDRVAQGKLAMAFRAPIAPGSPLLPAALVLAGMLGGTAVSRLFKVVRETHGLCYYASASWIRSRGLMLVQSGVEPKNEPKARRLILALVREVCGGTLETQAFEAVREAARARVAAMQDERGATLGYAQEMLSLGLDPRPQVHLNALLAVTPADVRRAGRSLGLESSFFLTGVAK